MQISTRDEATVSVVKPSAPERLRANRDTAFALADAGIPILPTKNKTPASLEWQRLDAEISEEERAAKIEAFNSEHSFDPLHVGATLNKERLREWMGSKHNATPSISLGPANLIVLDLDIKNGVDGVELFRAWAVANNIDVSQCPRTISQSGAQHIYFSNPDRIGCKRNAELQWDLKGVGGQVVAAGAIRAEDGRRYVAAADAPNLIEAYKSRTIPPIPMAIVEKFGANTKASATVSSIEEARLVRRLREDEWSSKDDLLDETIGFDLAALEDKDTEFRRLVTQRRSKVDEDKRDESASGNRWNLAKCLIREFGESFSVLDLAAAYELANERTDGAFGVYVGDNAPNAGEFDNRAIAREWAKLQGASERKVSEANFGPVQDEDESPTPKEKKTARKRFTYETFSQAVETAFGEEAEPLVEGLQDQDAMTVIYGDSNAGKSFVALSKAFHVAAGLNWNGRTVREGLVVYLALEGGTRFKRRIAALAKHYTIEGDIPLALVRSPVDLRSGTADTKAIIETVREIESAFEQKAVLVIIDTASRALSGGDENSSLDMGALVKNCDLIRHALGIHLELIHHTGKDRAKGARGHSLLRAATDTEIEVIAELRNGKPTGRGKIVVRKQRDLDFIEDIGFRLQKVELADKEGMIRSSAVAIMGSWEAPKAIEPARLRGNEADLYAVVTELAAERATAQKCDAESIGIAGAEIRARLDAKRQADGERPIKNFRDLKRQLLLKGLLVETEDGLIRLPGQAEFGAVEDGEDDNR